MSADLSHDESVIGVPPVRRHGHRYSRFVSLMKVVLPLTAVALVLLVAAWPQTQSEDSSFRVSLAAIPEGETGAPGMTRARFVGTDAKDQPFVITAESSVPEAANAEHINLQTLQADITVAGGTWVSMMSVRGLYDRAGQFLALRGGVDLFSDDGFEMHTASADVDLVAGVATGSARVEAHGPLGTLTADGFRLEQESRRLHFNGNVKMTIWQGAQ